MGQTGFLPCNGASIHYEMAGTGDTIVLLHGAPLDSRMWEPQMAALAKRYQVIRFDMRGMGQSVDPGTPFTLYEDLSSLLQQLHIRRASLIGASFGSYASVEFALAYPDVVQSLILVCPGGFAPPSEGQQRMFQKVQEQLATGNLDEALEINLHLLLDGPDQPRGRVTKKRSWLKEIYRDIFLQSRSFTKPDALQPDPRNRLAEIAVPTLVISGELDHPDFLETAANLVRTIPNATQRFCKNSAHFPSIDCPNEFVEIVEDFFRQQTPSAR
ncbi:alpha/beta fold hydrolase [Brevibacillus choshinensis]|uniref:Alpha/beta hydrolase n=1 Tax=Brevibacillus choshinensis TaxID=54911 RepID=A0ABX7FJE7_BRECH|nr:alpha/beta hydrolase [Brevibacillus choshinensis]QRG65125.1 alpha/beta hydrolase [Brevibacillus choshinensis]